MLQRRLERLYAKRGATYVPRAVSLQGHLLYPFIIAGVWLVSAYVEMSFGEYVRLALLGCALQFAYTVVSGRVVRRLNEPIAAWFSDQDDPARAEAAWRAATDLPLRFVRRTFSRSSLGVSLWVLYGIWVAYFDLQV